VALEFCEITPGSGKKIAVDRVTVGADTLEIQVVKLGLGADGSVPSILSPGQQAMADSLPVVIASNQSNLPVVLAAGSANVGDVDVLTVIPGTGATQLGKAVDSAAGATDTGVALLVIRDDTLTTLAPADGDYTCLRVNSDGALHVVSTGGSAGTEYTEGATDASITGTAILWEDTSDTLRAVSAAKPLPVAVISIAAGDNNIGNVDIVTLPALPAGTNNIGDVDVLTLPAIPAGTNNIGDVDVLTVITGTGATNLGKAVDNVAGSTDTGVLLLAVRDDALTTLSPADGDYTQLRVSSTGALHVTGAGGGTQYNEGDTDATITGTALLWEDASDTLRAVSNTKPLPVQQAQLVATLDEVRLGANASAVGLDMYQNLALLATKQAVKATPGGLYGWHIHNPNTSNAWVQLWNLASASVTVGTTAPHLTLFVPAEGGVEMIFPLGLGFGTAITAAATTGASNGTAPSTGLVVNLFYK
jgi:hypothetical protein